MTWDLDKSELKDNLEKVKEQLYKERRKLTRLTPNALKSPANTYSFMTPEKIEATRKRVTDSVESLVKLRKEINRRIIEKSITESQRTV